MFALVKTVKNPIDNSDVTSIKLFAPYTIWEDKNGIQYSPDTLLSLTTVQKQDLGIYDVTYTSRPDDRYFTVSEAAPIFDQTDKIVKITYTSTPKDLEDDGEIKGLKSQYISQIKQSSNSILSQTDWMLVRKVERNVAIPAATVAYRAAIIAEANRVEEAITEADSIESFRTAVESLTWPEAE